MMRRRSRARLCLLASGVAAVVLHVQSAGAVPNPVVTGPIAQNAPPGDPSHDYIFFTSAAVGSFGYVEEEFFIEGTANVYSTPPLATASIVSSGHPYKTRIVVRRPSQANRF